MVANEVLAHRRDPRVGQLAQPGLGVVGISEDGRQEAANVTEEWVAAPCVREEVRGWLGVIEIRIWKDRRKALLLRVCGRQLADAVPVEVVRDVLAVVLRVDLPKRLQVLASDHLEPTVSPRVASEICDVEHPAHKRDDDAALKQSGS